MTKGKLEKIILIEDIIDDIKKKIRYNRLLRNFYLFSCISLITIIYLNYQKLSKIQKISAYILPTYAIYLSYKKRKEIIYYDNLYKRLEKMFKS